MELLLKHARSNGKANTVCNAPIQLKTDFLGQSHGWQVLDYKWAAQCRHESVHANNGRTRGRKDCVLEVELLHSVIQE